MIIQVSTDTDTHARPRRPTEEMTTDTRNRLVDAARELFWREGYHATGVARILEAARANSGSLYHFFDGKEQLLAAVLDWYLENLDREIVEPAVRAADDPVERVLAILEGYRRALLATDLTFGCPIGSLALELRDPPPAVRRLLERNFAAWRQAVADCLAELGDELPPDADPGEVAYLVLSVMEGGVMQARTERSIEPFDASVRQLRRYLEGLRRQPVGDAGRPSLPQEEEPA